MHWVSILTGHGRDMRGNSAFALYFGQLECCAKFKQSVTTDDSSKKYSVGFQGLSYLNEHS
jgi:hypothetical protein